MQILSGHTSPETAYVVDDYPYSFHLRCRIRYWLHADAKKGARLMSQTSNPKRGHVWNTPKASTYGRFGAAMYLDGDDKVQVTHLHEFMDGTQVAAWMAQYGAGVPDILRATAERWATAKRVYDERRASVAVARSEGVK